MNREYQTLLRTSAAALLAVACVAGWMAIRAWHLPREASSAGVLMSEPIVAAQGQLLSHPVAKPALLITPSRLLPQDRRALHEAGLDIKGEPLLWRPSAHVREQWMGRPGIRAVVVKVDTPVPGVPAAMLRQVAALEKAEPRQFVLRGGVYEASRRAAVRTTFNEPLAHQLAALRLGPSGKLIAAGAGGSILALIDTGSVPQFATAGMAPVPPLLAQALADRSVSGALSHGAASLGSIGALWGRARTAAALANLGYGIQSSQSVNPASVLAGSTALQVSAAELVQSYLPFLDADHLARLHLKPGGGRVNNVPGDFSEVEKQMPTINVNGVDFCIWRPAGDFVVLLEPAAGRAVVLQGSADHAMVAVMQVLAANRS
jgi:hypothetical protein